MAQFTHKAEILAPCGSLETLSAAVKSGCDAVYLGGEKFSARQNAANFKAEQLREAVRICHLRGVKVYQAINTVVFDEQLEDCKAAVKFAAQVGVDGLITQDLALVEICKKCCRDMEYHASTQMTIHSESGVLMAKKLGFSRAVLSRELPKDIISQLAGLGIETEVFVHGALCMSVSGQCYMSAIVGSRSANRGLCAQACRLPAQGDKISKISKGRERYALSLKDMSYVDRLSELEKMGVSSLKIEGRMKRPEYVAAAVDCCKKSLENERYDLKALEAVFSRGGFTEGYYTRRLGREMFGTRQKEDVSATAKILPELHELYRRCEKRSKVKFRFLLKDNEQARLYVTDELGNEAQAVGDKPMQAIKKPCDEEYVAKQLSKLGDTIYEFGGVEADIGEGLAFPASQLNEMRRHAIAGIDEKRIGYFDRSVGFSDAEFAELTDFESLPKAYDKKRIRIMLSEASQLEGLDLGGVELCGVPIEFAKRAAEVVDDRDRKKLMVIMPRFTFDEKGLIKKLEEAKAAGIGKMLAMNIGHCLIAEKMGFELHTGYAFNVTNSAALGMVKKLGAKDCTVSFELKAAQIERLKKPMEIGFVAYGRLPLMLTANCPIRNDVGCKNCKGKLFDRTGREFPVRCPKGRDCAEVLNSDILYLADKLSDFANADYMELHFYEETAEKINAIVRAYAIGHGEKPFAATNGLYYRGVL